MRHDDIDIGGREVGAVRLEFIGDQRRCEALIGESRVFLGNLKRSMAIGNLHQGQNIIELPSRKEVQLLYDLLIQGYIVGSVPVATAKNTNVIIDIKEIIQVKSIKGQGQQADVDSIKIMVNILYSIKAEEQPSVIGFTVHFRDTSNWQQNVNYIVAEPFKTSSLSVGVTARSRDDISYADVDAWRQDILNYGIASSNFYSPYWFRAFGWQYRPTTGNPIYDQATPILGKDYPGDGSDLTIAPTLESIYDQVAFDLRYTSYGLYAISKPDFNHVDSGKYDFENGFVGKVECFLKIKKKQTLETAIKYSVPFENDVAGGFDPVELTGNNLLVDNPGAFLEGWYGIGMVTWDQGSGRDSNIGGFTFIFHMSDGTERKVEWHDIELHSGNYAYPDPRAADINPGKAYAFFNPSLGLLALYEDTPPSDNPFYASDASYGNTFYPALRKDYDPSITPTRVFSVFSEPTAKLSIKKNI